MRKPGFGSRVRSQSLAKIDRVIEEVHDQCMREGIPMIGREKGLFIESCVLESKPGLVVECGTGAGYSGLWILRALQRNASGRFITIEIDEVRESSARENFARAGVAEFVELRLGDAREVLETIQQPVDFLVLDHSDDYYPSFQAVESRLTSGATLLTHNVAAGKERRASYGQDSMVDFLEQMRASYGSETHWFDAGPTTSTRDAIEVTIYRR